MLSMQAGRPFLVMPSALPQAFALRSFLPHLPVAQGHPASQFPFPSPPSAFSSHLPPSPSSYPTLPLLPSVPPQGTLGASPFSLFQQLLTHSAENSVSSTTVEDVNSPSGPQTPQYVSVLQQREQGDHSPSAPTLAGDSFLSIPQASELQYHPSTSQIQQDSPRSNSQLSNDETSSKQEENSLDGGSDPLIDVESTEQEEEEEQVTNRHAFLDLGTCRRKHQRKRTNQTEISSLSEQEECTKPTNQAIVSSKNWQCPPALVNVAGEEDHSNTVSQIIKRVEPATRVLTQDMITSALEKHRLYFDGTNTHGNGENFDMWKRGPKLDQITPNPPSPLSIDHHSIHHPPTPVICS